MALVLEAANVPYVAIEMDLVRFRRAKKDGHRVLFGDASRKRVLEAAGLSRARLIVVTFDRREHLKRLLRIARESNPAVLLIISTGDDQNAAALVTDGVGAVFPENFAAGLALADQVLLQYGLSREAAANPSRRCEPSSIPN